MSRRKIDRARILLVRSLNDKFTTIDAVESFLFDWENHTKGIAGEWFKPEDNHTQFRMPCVDDVRQFARNNWKVPAADLPLVWERAHHVQADELEGLAQLVNMADQLPG